MSALKGRKIMYKNDGENGIKQDEVISEMYMDKKMSKGIHRKRIKSESGFNHRKKLYL